MKSMQLNYLYFPLCAISMMLCLASCDDEDDAEIQYPETGFYGDNILMKGRTEYNEVSNSFQAVLPKGKKLKILITGNPAFPHVIWGSSAVNNWAVSNFDRTTYSQAFQSIDDGHTCVLEMNVTVGSYQIDYYENGATSPTYSKTIVVNY
jgi:hypothetical protein